MDENQTERRKISQMRSESPDKIEGKKRSDHDRRNTEQNALLAEALAEIRAEKSGSRSGQQPSELVDQHVKKDHKHVVASGETLISIAFKHYRSAAKDKWMSIYEANKEIIGDNPNLIQVGQELIIPDIE